MENVKQLELLVEEKCVGRVILCLLILMTSGMLQALSDVPELTYTIADWLKWTYFLDSEEAYNEARGIVALYMEGKDKGYDNEPDAKLLIKWAERGLCWRYIVSMLDERFAVERNRDVVERVWKVEVAPFKGKGALYKWLDQAKKKWLNLTKTELEISSLTASDLLELVINKKEGDWFYYTYDGVYYAARVKAVNDYYKQVKVRVYDLKRWNSWKKSLVKKYGVKVNPGFYTDFGDLKVGWVNGKLVTVSQDLKAVLAVFKKDTLKGWAAAYLFREALFEEYSDRLKGIRSIADVLALAYYTALKVDKTTATVDSGFYIPTLIERKRAGLVISNYKYSGVERLKLKGYLPVKRLAFDANESFSFDWAQSGSWVAALLSGYKEIKKKLIKKWGV